MMPAKSRKQQKFMGAEYARAKAGKKTKTGMGKKKLSKKELKKWKLISIPTMTNELRAKMTSTWPLDRPGNP